MRKTIDRIYQFTNNTMPVWRVIRKVVTRCYKFEAIDPKTGKTIGITNLIWCHDSDDEREYDLYHGCKYRFSGYNPMPVTGWFRGVPLNQMLQWCYDHNLVGGECISQNVHITYEDKTYVPKVDDYEVF